jgi:hypothetical protein
MDKTCPTCLKIFANKSNLKYHLQRKKACVPPSLETTIVALPKKHKCDRCHSLFETPKKLTNHLNRKNPCIIKNSQSPHLKETELRILFEQLRKEHEKLCRENQQHKLEITKLQRGVLNSNNTIQNNSNNTNNITVNMYGYEDMSHITDEQYKHCFRQMPQSVECLFDLKHFSEKMPQNHNMYISNIKDSYMMIFRQKAWMLADREMTLKTIYYDIKEDLSRALDKMRSTGTIEKNLERFFSPFVEDDLDENKEAEMKRISFKKMILKAYNCRHLPMKIHSQMEKERLGQLMI